MAIAIRIGAERAEHAQPEGEPAEDDHEGRERHHEQLQQVVVHAAGDGFEGDVLLQQACELPVPLPGGEHGGRDGDHHDRRPQSAARVGNRVDVDRFGLDRFGLDRLWLDRFGFGGGHLGTRF